jgi:antitoxin ParD1/3/4
MNVSLTKELEELVSGKVKTGLYHTASEVIREGLRLLEERDRLYQVRLEELRRDVKLGIDQLDRGESMPFDPVAVKRRLRKRVRAKTRRGTK